MDVEIVKNPAKKKGGVRKVSNWQKHVSRTVKAGGTYKDASRTWSKRDGSAKANAIYKVSGGKKRKKAKPKKARGTVRASAVAKVSGQKLNGWLRHLKRTTRAGGTMKDAQRTWSKYNHNPKPNALYAGARKNRVRIGKVSGGFLGVEPRDAVPLLKVAAGSIVTDRVIPIIRDQIFKGKITVEEIEKAENMARFIAPGMALLSSFISIRRPEFREIAYGVFAIAIKDAVKQIKIKKTSGFVSQSQVSNATGQPAFLNRAVRRPDPYSLGYSAYHMRLPSAVQARNIGRLGDCVVETEY